MFAYIASTVLVILWLLFTIQITLQENREAAAGATDPGTTSELIRVCQQALLHCSIPAQQPSAAA